ncbi:MAG: hypothetical protein ACTIJD_08230 [Staphylococcus saprophyticus]
MDCTLKNFYQNEVSQAIKFLKEDVQLSNQNMKNSDEEFYVFLVKHVVFFKVLSNTYSETREFKVIISDFLYYIINDIKRETRNNFLIERSIIENYIRISLNSLNNNSHITYIDFNRIKQMYNMDSNSKYNTIIDAYKKSCDYIHGGELIDSVLSKYIQDVLTPDSCSSRKKNKENVRKTNLIHALDYLLFKSKIFEIDNAFHRNKSTLKYLITSKEINDIINDYLK